MAETTPLRRKIIELHPLKVKDVVTLTAAMLAVFATLLVYHLTSNEEFLKPIRQKQLDLYVEASGAASSLATLPPEGIDWNKARNDFQRLCYGPLAMFEDYQRDFDAKN
jgi:hypothetical protein